MRYRLSHRTSYSYTNSVDSAHHVAHLRARDFPGQQVLSTEIVAAPVPAATSQRVDHFGNHMDLYRIDEPHKRFEIEVKAEIEVSIPAPPALSATPAWEEIRAGLNGAGFPTWIEASEFVHDSPLVMTDDTLRDYGAVSLTAGRPILAAARELTSRIKADFEYRPGSTDISTPLHEVFEGKSGVCQDFAHVLIALCRAIGIPARYVSGYIVRDSASAAPTRGAGASHAWVEAFTPTHGWRGFDPTNDLVASEHHVKMAIGRDYRDVPPTQGTFRGAADETLSVDVVTQVHV